MRSIIQRVTHASVTVDDRVVGSIEAGLLVYLGVADGDQTGDADYIVEKIAGVRIFRDDADKMNRSVVDVGGQILLVSAFAVCGDARKGRRPSFSDAAAPEPAQQLYEYVGAQLRNAGLQVETGVFAAHMLVSATNDGPISILLDSQRLF